MPDFGSHLYNLTADILNVVASTAVPAAVGLGLNYMRKRFGLNVKKQQREELEALAVGAVQNASQRFRKDEGKDRNARKRQGAVNQLTNRAAALGVKLAANAAGDLVEAAVNKLKRERGAL